MSADIPEEVRNSLRIKLKSHATAAAGSASGDTDGLATQESEAIASGDYDRENLNRQKAETAGLHERNRDRRVNRKLRAGYARSVFCYLVCYSIFVAVVLLLSGFKVCGFTLPEGVLSFLVGSTAAAAIGLVFAVTHGLFDGIGKV